MRRFGRRSLWEVRQYSQTNNIAGAAGNTVVDTLLFSPTSYTGSANTAKMIKSFTIRIANWCSDYIVNNATAGNSSITLYEFVYIAETNTVGANLFGGASFQANETGSSDVRVFPTRMLLRRACLLEPVFGSAAGLNINWVPWRSRNKIIVKENQALWWRMEVFNAGTTAVAGGNMALAALAIKANP